MKLNARIKMIVDIAMTAALLLLMAYTLVGEEAHEWIGISMSVLFIIHHILNIGFLKNLFRGRYTAARIVMTCVAAVILLCMLGLMISGVILSNHVFCFLHIRGLSSFGRSLHMLCAYWGFVFMSVHLGLHWDVITGRIKGLFGAGKHPGFFKWVFRIAGSLIAIWGAAAFIRYDLPGYLFLQNHFAFFDAEETLAVFILNYAAIMGLWAWIAHYAMQFIKKFSLKRERITLNILFMIC